MIGDTQEHWERETNRRWERGKGVGRGAASYDRKKAWFSINHLILSGYNPGYLLQKLQRPRSPVPPWSAHSAWEGDSQNLKQFLFKFKWEKTKDYRMILDLFCIKYDMFFFKSKIRKNG